MDNEIVFIGKLHHKFAELWKYLTNVIGVSVIIDLAIDTHSNTKSIQERAANECSCQIYI